ncbi:MAG: nucleotidyltransferase domain-containing protein [Acidimicrobiales bacterium]
MNLSHPIRSIIPSGHGAALAVLARTDRPLSGRGIAELTGGGLSPSRANEVLRELTEAGLVLCEEHPPARLYVLNRAHVAADTIVALAHLREELLRRMRAHLGTWSPAPVAAWLFGSFARGEGDAHSDIDICIIRPDRVSTDDAAWAALIDSFTDDVAAWSGNRCSIVEYSETEFTKRAADGERLPADLHRDGILLAGTDRTRRPTTTAR